MTNLHAPQKSGKAATRLRLQPWKDPRLLIGVLLVLGATVLGARLTTSDSEGVEYWSVRGHVTAGDRVQQDDLEPARVTLTGSADANYVRTSEEFMAPFDELVWAHDIAPGTLVVKEAVVAAGARHRGELPLNVAVGSSPPDLARGDVVDVWVGPGPGDETAGKAERVLESVRVLRAGGSGASTDGGLAETVLVDVNRRELDESVVGPLASGHVTLVRVS